MKLLLINGPNINLLGIREPKLYGGGTYADLLELVERTGKELAIEIDCFQSNHEGEIVDKIQQAYGDADGIIINPAAYTHTSIAILDALKAVSLPSVEIHITDISSREEFRRVSYASMACLRTIKGMGLEGYRDAIIWLAAWIDNRRED